MFFVIFIEICLFDLWGILEKFSMLIWNWYCFKEKCFLILVDIDKIVIGMIFVYILYVGMYVLIINDRYFWNFIFIICLYLS